MSTIIFHELSSGVDVENDRHSAVKNQQAETIETLADYVQRVRNEKGFSLKKVEYQSDNGEDRITDSYVSRIENGLITNVSPRMLRALARGLCEPEDVVFAVARGKSLTETADPEDEEMQVFFYRYKNLSKKDKDELRPSWEMFKREVERRNQKRS